MPPKQTRFSDITVIKEFRKEEILPEAPILLFRPRSILKDGIPWAAKAKAAGYVPKGKHALPKRKRKKDSNAKLEAITRAKALQQSDPRMSYKDISKPPKPTETPRKRGRPKKKLKPVICRSAANKRRSKLATKAIPLAEKALILLSRNNKLNPSREKLIKDQANDNLCRALLDYITKGILPEDNALGRQILLSHDNFIIIDKILFKLNTSIFGKTNDPTLQIVIPEKWVQPLLSSTHNAPLGGHLGVTKIYNLLKSNYY